MDETSERHIHSRVSVLEDAVGNLHTDLSEVKQQMSAGFRDIQSVLSNYGKPNWTIIFGGIALIMAIWAAAIYPMQQTLDRHERQAETLAQAVVDQNKTIDAMSVQQAINQSRISALEVTVTETRLYGSPATGRRLSLIESKLGLPDGSGVVK